tara:strand:+ start:1605 stop:2555 length:951 start_codon:yes stop_codon:yes gene_type:complete
MIKAMKNIALSASCLLFLGACAEMELASHVVKTLPSPPLNSNSPATKSEGHFKVGNAYRIEGRKYKPFESYDLVETGVSSWYGPNFHGKRTANGETFNMYDMTAAHRTLQLPSIIRVTNLENGRSAIMRVNDRGPFSKDRVLDVSKKGAEVLGFQNQGTTKVRIEVLKEESQHVAAMAKKGLSTRGIELAMARNPNYLVASKQGVSPSYIKPRSANLTLKKPLAVQPVEAEPVLASAAATPSDAVYVQAGAFRDAHNAQKMVDALRAFGNAHVKPRLSDGGSLYSVRFGPMQVADANNLVSKLGQAKRIDAIAVRD